MPDGVRHESIDNEPPAPTEHTRLITPLRTVVVFIGLALIAAAVWTVLANRAELDRALAAIRGAPWYLLIASLLLPLVNWVCTTATFCVLTGRYVRVPMREMLPLIGSAWLLNMLPFRLGMIGRVAYHKKYHGLRVRDCAKVMIQALACSGVALAVLLVGVLAAGTISLAEADDRAAWSLLAFVLILPLVALLAATWITRARADALHTVWRWCAAVAARYVDMLVWFVRYVIVFLIIGQPLPALTAAGITVSAQAAMVTPIQFGLREWAVGMTSALMAPPPIDHATPLTPHDPLPIDPSSPKNTLLARSATGIVCDACMRAAELAVVIPVGLLSTLWVMRSLRRGQ